MKATSGVFALLATSVLVLSGCARAPSGATPPKEESDKLRAARAGLSKDDQALVEAQEYCPISSQRLGSMDAPVKVTIKDQPVFLCCKGCEKSAVGNPDGTLAKVADLKARVKNDHSEH